MMTSMNVNERACGHMSFDIDTISLGRVLSHVTNVYCPSKLSGFACQKD
jgi:hypothetical protein